LSTNRQLVDDRNPKKYQESMVILKLGKFLQNSFVQLHSPSAIFRESGQRLAESEETSSTI
jgi:hypothetical protein